MTFFERYKLTSRLSMSKSVDIWVGSVSLSSMVLEIVKKEIEQ